MEHQLKKRKHQPPTADDRFSNLKIFYTMTQVKFQPLPFGGLISQLANAAMDQLNDRFEHPANVRPAVNVLETATGYELQIAAPGFSKSEISVNVEADLLTVTAKKAESQESNSPKWQRREFGATQMSRSFNLPETIDAENISARHENGVLTLTLTKKPEIKPAVKTIEVA